MNSIRVLVIDESIHWRETLRDVFEEARDIQLIGVSPRVATGLTRMRAGKPDVLLLSAEAPDQTPSAATVAALKDNPLLGVLLTVSPESDAAAEVIRSLEAGAFDFVLKPEAKNGGRALSLEMARRILPRIRTFSAAQYSRKARGFTRPVPTSPTHALPTPAPAKPIPTVRVKRSTKATTRPEVVVAGISTGGPEALSKLLPALPATFPVPIVIVQHMPAEFIGSLAESLDRSSRLHVQPGAHGIALRPGNVYLARGGCHLHLSRNAHRELALREADSPPENGFKPSADVLFRSAAKKCGSNSVALIMTGMGDDGSRGLREMKAAGSFVIAQDEESSVVWGMPGTAVKAGLANETLPLDEIAERITKWVGR